MTERGNVGKELAARGSKRFSVPGTARKVGFGGADLRNSAPVP